jgi:hypothetical protein
MDSGEEYLPFERSFDASLIFKSVFALIPESPHQGRQHEHSILKAEFA